MMFRLSAPQFRSNRLRHALLSSAMLAIVAAPAVAYAQADSPSAQTRAGQVQFNVAPQELDSALTRVADQGGIRIFFTSAELSGLRSNGVSGTMTLEQALSQVLTGTGFGWRYQEGRTIVIERLPEARGAMQLGPVRVEGGGQTAYSPSSGEGNLATSDNKRSYTSSYVTIAGKLPVNVREIPNTVTVVTRQRMDDQNMLTAQDALKDVTGVTALSYSGSGDAHYFSRGFGMTAQFDGMPGSVDALRGFVQFDLPMYDRIEVLKGPVGLLQGSTGIGGTINFARKKPRHEFALSANGQVGSWDFFHGDLDVTGPINSSGSIRARVVASGTDRDYFYKTAYDKRWLGYGVVEVDVLPETTLTLSVARQEDRSIPSYGLPSFSGGRPTTDLPRSTFVGADWGKVYNPMTEYYAELSHSFGNDWLLRAAYTKRDLRFKGMLAYALGQANPTTLIGNLYAQASDQHYEWDSADVYVGGPFELFGRTHQVLVGANWAEHETHNFFSNGQVIPVNVLNPQAAQPSLPLASGSSLNTQQYGFYGQLRLKPTDRLTIVAGGRLSHFESKNRTIFPTEGRWVPGAHVGSEFTPYAGLIFDVTKHVSLYASYADMFFPQTALRVSGEVLPPEQGVQYEAGVKGQFFDGALNASFAYFNIRDRNRALTDPANPTFYVPQGENESQGVEAEVSGNITPNWEIVAGYAYTKTQYLKPKVAGSLDPRFPRHSFKLTSNYRFSDGPLTGLRLGGSLQVQGSIDSGENPPVLTQDSYAVVDLQAGYAITKNVTATLSVNNAFDKKYFQRLGFTSFFNWYGEPRNVMLSVRAAF